MEQDLYEYIKSIKHIIDASVKRIFPSTQKVGVQWSPMIGSHTLTSKWRTGPGGYSNPASFKGNSYINAGYVYAPYVPLHRNMSAPTGSNTTIYDRYAVKCINKDFYSTIRIED